jgi:hypothetical protein
MASEKISVVLEADAKQLTSEFQRARESADNLSKKTLPLVDVALNRMDSTSRQVVRGMGQLQKATRGTGQGMLQLAYFADDAQYGIRGVLNNIAPLVMGFGAGAGLAGAISIAALAGSQLLPILKELFTDADAPRIAAVAKATQERFAAELKALAVLREEKQIREETATLLSGMAAYADRELRVQDQRLAILTSQRQEMELQRRLADQLTSARNSLALAGASSPTSAAALQAGQSAAAGNLTVDRLREELDLARREASIANAEYDRMAVEAANLRTASQATLTAAREKIAALERNVAVGRASVAGFELGIENGLHGSRANLEVASKRLAAEEAALARQRELVTQMTAEQERAAALAREQLNTLSDRIDAATREKMALEKQIPVMEELNRLSRERQETEERAAEEARLNGDLEARRASMAAARQRWEDEQIMKGNGTGTPTRDIDALRREAYRSVTGLRDRAIREAGLIPTARGISAGSGGMSSRLQGPRGLDGPRGLGPETRRRFGREDAPADMTNAQKAAAYYVKALENDEKLIKAFNALGLL